MRFCRFLIVLSVFTGFVAFLAPSETVAEPKASISALNWWWPEHWLEQDFKPYMNDSKIRHNSQWENDPWTPQEWVDAKGSVQAVLNGFYEARIITDQSVDDTVPVLEVGQRFLDLSEQEKRRVVAFVDYAFGVTKSAPAGMFKIQLIKKREPIGVYTKDGLQLQ